ncbi:MAG: zinc metalloprotease HtpX [Candidatus Woesearchaeota archaeon]
MWNQIKTVLLLGALTGLMLAIGMFLAGTTGLTVALAFALLMNFITYFFSAKIVLWMYRAKEAKKNEHSRLHHIVENVAKKAGIPKPKVYIIPSEQPNAFATGRNPKNGVVACTEGIMKLLNHDELEGVIAHEIAHIRNRDILIATIAATIAAVISYVTAMARWSVIFGSDDDRGNIFSIILLSIITPIVAMIIQLAISRAREYHADATGARFIANTKGLASALKKIERAVHSYPMRFGNAATSSLFIQNPFTFKGVMSLLSTHPPTDERIKRLNRMSF